MITAGHNIDTPEWVPDTEWVSGTEPEKEANFDPNQVRAGSTTGLDVFDAATLDPKSGVEMAHEFAAEGGVTEGDIRGCVDEEHLKDIEDGGTDQYFSFMHQGARTGKDTEFGIDKMGSDAFKTTLHQSETKGGDSGGPYYLRNSSSIMTKPGL